MAEAQSSLRSLVTHTQLMGRLRELALIRALECRERGFGPAQIAADADNSGRPCKLRMQVLAPPSPLPVSFKF